jgi:hypothetical protein
VVSGRTSGRTSTGTSRSNDTFLDHDNNQIPGAEGDWFLGAITDPGGHRNGTFTIDVSSYAALGYDTFMIHIKTGNDGGYFLLDGPAVDGLLSGTFSITGLPGCMHGNCQERQRDHAPDAVRYQRQHRYPRAWLPGPVGPRSARSRYARKSKTGRLTSRRAAASKGMASRLARPLLFALSGFFTSRAIGNGLGEFL